MSLRYSALFLLMLAGAGAPAFAQQGAPPAAGADPQVSGARPKVDETALRYFSAQGDQRRLETEMARLRALYPDWTPPTDLNAGPVAADTGLQRMWRLFAEGRIADVRREIAARQTTEPSWTPPRDLLAKLDDAEALRRLANASDAAQWKSVIDIASDAPGLLTCSNVDTLWRVAEAFAKTDRAARARDAYSYVLTNCTDTGERLATMQKALAVLPEPVFDELFALERKAPDGTGEFASIRVDRLRARVGRAAQQPMMTVPAAELAEIEKLARDGKEADDALLLGWYLYRHQQPDKAADLFKSALDRGGGAKAAEGYVLALGASGRGLDAVPVAYEWREATVETKKAYTDVMIALLAADPPRKLPPDMLAQFVPFVNSERSAEGAEALGWFAYNTGQVRTAENWFKASLGWRETEAAAFGLAVVKKRLGDRAGFDSLVRIWRDRSPRIARLASSRAAGPTIDPGLAVRTAWNALSEPRGDTLGDAVPLARDEIEAEDRDDSGAERAAPIRLAARQSPCALGRPRPETMAAELALTFAWCLMDLERPLEALPYFERALTIGSAPVKSHAAYGKSLAYLRKGLTDEAAVSAAAAPQDERRNAELTTGILTQRALAFYKEKRFTETLITLDERAKYIPEQNDLMMLRGWSYFELGRYDEAEQVFRAVLKTGFSTEGNRGIAAIQSRTKQVKD